MPDQEQPLLLPMTATVTAFQRIDQTIRTIEKILACRPAPDELLVHVDAGGDACLAEVRRVYPDIRVISSDVSIGPGGGRNKLMAAAKNELMANFDDDSYPIDSDFFARVAALFEELPGVSVFSGACFHRSEAFRPSEHLSFQAASFLGGAVVFRRSHLMEVGGYLPLAVAYGAEEEDMALRLLDRGRTMRYSPWLRVFHDTDLSHHNDPRLVAQSLANIGLLAFLRYPAIYWPYGLLQIGNRLVWCMRHGRTKGLLAGLLALPRHLWRHRRLRKPVTVAAMREKRALRRKSAQANIGVVPL